MQHNNLHLSQTRIKQRYNSLPFLWIFLLGLQHLHLASARTASDNLAVVTAQSQKGDLRTDIVGRKLCDRLDYVQSGKRESDFCQWLREHGGNATIFSMHGVEIDFNTASDEERGLDLTAAVTHKLKRGDPFLPDRMNLELSTDHNKQHYRGRSLAWDNRPPSILQLSLRAARLSLHFGPVVSTTFLALCSRRFRRNIWYKWLASSLASSGAAFIKWGQWASTRNDMFCDGLCDALGNLLNSAPEHSWATTQALVEASLDIPQGCLLDVFSEFDPKPLASGSIAQIHKARLKNGQCVAAKVRHPKVEQLIDLDFRLMTFMARVSDCIPGLRWLNIKESVSQFSHTMAAQAHLQVEAHHLEVLNHNFNRWSHVRFPKPFYASDSVILETFEAGKIVTDILDIYDEEAGSISGNDCGPNVRGHELIPVSMAKFLVTSGVSIYLKMLLVDNLMHADLHPGNIMLDVLTGDLAKGHAKTSHPTPTLAPKLGITLVDAGMVAQLTDEESSTFIGVLAALGEGDGRAAAEFALRFSIENNMGEKEREQFIEEMIALFAIKCRGYGTDVDVGDVLRSILSLIRIHHVRIDANYATLVVNVLCVESLAQRVCPSYNVLEASKPLLQAYRKHFFESDGVTPKADPGAYKKFKAVMPVMYFRKKRADDLFFKKISLENRRKKLSPS